MEHDAGEGVEPDRVLMRREEYEAPAPSGVTFVRMGVDVQDDRLEALVVGWGPGEESWLLDRHEFGGDTSRSEPWAMVDAQLGEEYRHEGGDRLPISAPCIDSAGHRTDVVYSWVRTQRGRRVHATIGRAGLRPIVASPSRPQPGRGGRRRARSKERRAG